MFVCIHHFTGLYLWTYMKPCRKVYMHIEINMRIYSTMSGYQGVLWWAYAIGPLGQHHGTQCETTARIRRHEGRLALFAKNPEAPNRFSSPYREEMSLL
jgi:hypothetical protein